jgi:hypothetical protein
MAHSSCQIASILGIWFVCGQLCRAVEEFDARLSISSADAQPLQVDEIRFSIGHTPPAGARFITFSTGFDGKPVEKTAHGARSFQPFCRSRRADGLWITRVLECIVGPARLRL